MKRHKSQPQKSKYRCPRATLRWKHKNIGTMFLLWVYSTDINKHIFTKLKGQTFDFYTLHTVKKNPVDLVKIYLENIS